MEFTPIVGAPDRLYPEGVSRFPTDTVSLFRSHPGWAERFQVIRLLGEGSAGLVYHVLDRRRDNAEMAFKILINKDAYDENTLVRFRREMEVCQNLRHPNLVEAYDFLEDGGKVGFTMEFVGGLDLGKLCARARLEYSEIDRVLEELLSALDELHRKAIVHRDVKLENIMMRNDGVIKLGDLGLVKLCEATKITRTGVLLGTAQYMPPEYIKYNRYEPAGDIYSVGVALYEMLSGKRRLAGLNGMEAIRHLFKTGFDMPREDLGAAPERYRRLLGRALSNNPKKRYQNAGEMLKELRSMLENPDSPRFSISPGLHLQSYSTKKRPGRLRRLFLRIFSKALE